LRPRLLLPVLVVLVLAAGTMWRTASSPPSTGDVDEAFAARTSGVQVDAAGRVQRVLADDREGSAHQRFIVELPSGLTVLVAHNIDLAPRVPELDVGDDVVVHGQYEWNEKGGVIHWTHHDPQGRHAGGWIEHDGRRYE
jgi:hypothetical protein